MRKKLPKNKTKCSICNKVYLIKDLSKHIESEEHIRKSEEIKKDYENALDSLINYKG